MAAPFRLRQQNALLQNKLDPMPANTPTTPQSEVNFFDTLRDSYVNVYEDDEEDARSSRSSRSSITTHNLANRLNKLIPRAASERSSPETTYAKISKEEAERVRNLDNVILSRTPSRKSEDRKSIVVKSIKGDVGGNITIVTDVPKQDDVKFIRNEPPVVVQNNPPIHSFSVSPSFTPVRPQRSPDRINEIPIPPRSHYRMLSQDDNFAQQNTLPYPPPLRKSSFDKETTMKYINRTPPQQPVIVHQSVPPIRPVQPQSNQQMQQLMQQPQSGPPPVPPVPPIQNHKKDQVPFQTFQQPVIPTKFRSRENSHAHIPPAPIYNHPNHPPPPTPPTPPQSQPPTQQQEKKMYVGQRITPANSPVNSPRPSNVSSLDIVPSVWPRGETTLVRKSEELDDVVEEEEGTLKQSSDEHGDEENRKRKSRRKSKSRSRSRDRESTDGGSRSGEGGEKKRRKKRRGGVVLSKKMRRVIKVVGTIMILNLVIVDALVVALFVATFL